MCGIYGFFGKIKKGKHKNVLKLMKQLAIETEIRGVDATGYFSIGKNDVMMEKDAIEASQFVEADNTFVNSILDNDPHIWVGHNRAASMGDLDSNSAHPFVGDKYLMVHNGTYSSVFNLIDDSIKAKMKTKTDSEAILYLIERDGLEETFKKISKYSIVIADINTDELWFARDPKRPMVIFDLRKQYGIRMFCSTSEIGQWALATLRFNIENLSYFSTKSFHLYSADHRDGEINNIGRYYAPIPPAPGPIYEPPPHTDPATRPTSMGRRIWEKYFKIETKEDKEKAQRIQNSMAVYGD